MKKFGKTRFREAWAKLMDSTQRKLSRGADNISKVISWARIDNWRRQDKDRTPKSGKAGKKKRD